MCVIIFKQVQVFDLDKYSNCSAYMNNQQMYSLVDEQNLMNECIYIPEMSRVFFLAFQCNGSLKFCYLP